MNKRKLVFIILIVAVLLVAGFIFYNALGDFNASHGMSDAVAQTVLPNKYETNEDLLLLIRKIAHLIEYATLGVATLLLSLLIKKEYGKNFVGFSFFIVLAVSVIDEYIQSFSDRSGAVSDVVLDFCGAMIGFSIVAATVFIKRIIKGKKAQKNL